MEEKEDLEREIEKLKKDLSDYLNLVPVLGVSQKEQERTINQYLDDILNRQERIKRMK